MRILVILLVWPEPTSSAAGVRTHQLLEILREEKHTITLSSPCQRNRAQEEWEERGFTCVRHEPNSPSFNEYLREYDPQVVIFDRFMIEEQFSWRVREVCPEAVRILDTVDLHFLRKLRQKRALAGENPFFLPESLITEDSVRELASIYRSDLTLVVSDAEEALLTTSLGVPRDLVSLSRYGYSLRTTFRSFSERGHVVAVGNFNHPPNLDAARLLAGPLWNTLRNKLALRGRPEVELHLYGAYPSDEVLRLQDPSRGIKIMGWARDIHATLSAYRLNLAPLRFGAGVKGKILDGWCVGTPCVTTTLGAEGMHESLPFGGEISDSWDEFTELAASLYLDESRWSTLQNYGAEILRVLFDPESTRMRFVETVISTVEKRQGRRMRNVVGALLWHHSHRSTEYFSKWIEAKNKLR